MDDELIKIIDSEFPASDQEFVRAQLESVTLHHVMAQSETNLCNTRMAILKLSEGDSSKVQKYVGCAKEDFRDVIYWAST